MPKLQILTTREVQSAREGDHSDGGGLILRVRGTSASWVLRYASPTGRRREMGLVVVHRGTTAQAAPTGRPRPDARPRHTERAGFAFAAQPRAWTVAGSRACGCGLRTRAYTRHAMKTALPKSVISETCCQPWRTLRHLTFDMSGRWWQAEPAGRLPLDRRVRRCQQQPGLYPIAG